MTELRHIESSLREYEIYFCTFQRSHNNLSSNVITDMPCIDSNAGHSSMMLLYSILLCAKHYMDKAEYTMLPANSTEDEISTY